MTIAGLATSEFLATQVYVPAMLESVLFITRVEPCWIYIYIIIIIYIKYSYTNIYVLVYNYYS